MIEIPEPQYYHKFTTPIFFIRTGKIRDAPQDCTREELIDLNIALLSEMEKNLGILEKSVDSLERMLGYRESLIQEKE